MNDVEKMGYFLAALEEQSKQSNNDIRWGKYVRYVNTFLKRFGQERIHLVGSTGEKTKLTFSKDDGDADFIIVSGIYEVDLDQLEYNEYNNCYLRIRADERSKALGIETVDGKYISTDYLRFMKPELYTIVRAIRSTMIAARGYFSESEGEDKFTFITMSSKVGIVTTRYRNLQLDEKLQTRLKQNRQDKRRTYPFKAYNREIQSPRWKDVEFHEADWKIFCRIGELFIGTENENRNYVLAFTTGMFLNTCKCNTKQSAMPSTHSPKAEQPETDMNEECSKDPASYSGVTQYERCLCNNWKSSTYTESQNASFQNHALNFAEVNENLPRMNQSLDEEAIETKCQKEKASVDDLNLSDMCNTYQEKFHMDFVPVMKLKGKLDFMKQWRQRAENANMDRKLIDTIYDVDIFVVSRIAPKHSNVKTDFCLSFNIAETKLVSSMTTMQRNTFLVMKAFFKGVFETCHKKDNHDLKLKTYHLKTLLFWFFELNQDFMDFDDTVENVMLTLECAIHFLKEKLEQRMLPHYFVGSNLFSEFEDADYPLLLECVDKVLSDPVGSLQCYFDLDDGKPCDIELTEEEVLCLIQISKDQGQSKYLHQLEDARVDLQRGFNLGPRDDDMRAPIKEAVLDIIRLVLEDKQSNALDFLQVFGVFDANSKNLLEEYGGRHGFEQFVRSVFAGDEDLMRSFDQQILEMIDRYLSCEDREENKILDLLISQFNCFY